MRILLKTFLQVYFTYYFCKINKISFQHYFVGTTKNHIEIKNKTEKID